jgi:ribosome biogenesis protein BRX1
MDEMKLTGNAMRGSRPILSFDKGFEEQPHWLLIKELFVQVRDYYTSSARTSHTPVPVRVCCTQQRAYPSFCLSCGWLQVFGTPKGHRKSKPFIDHIFHFSIVDDKIWFRNYQV